MLKLQTISESIKRSINEAHVDTDKMRYADTIAKALQTQKTELGNLWSAEIINSGSDETNGNGGGRIKYTIPAVPCEVEYQVEINNHVTPGPKLDDNGIPIPGEEIAEDSADVTISVSIDDNMIAQATLPNQPITNLNDAVKQFVLSAVNQHHAKQKVHESKKK